MKVRSVCHSSAMPPLLAASSKISGWSVERILEIGVAFEWSEESTEGHMLGLTQVLVGEEEHLVFEQQR